MGYADRMQLTSLSITAFPVLARTLADRKLMHTRAGVSALIPTLSSVRPGAGHHAINQRCSPRQRV